MTSSYFRLVTRTPHLSSVSNDHASRGTGGFCSVGVAGCRALSGLPGCVVAVFRAGAVGADSSCDRSTQPDRSRTTSADVFMVCLMTCPLRRIGAGVGASQFVNAGVRSKVGRSVSSRDQLVEIVGVREQRGRLVDPD